MRRSVLLCLLAPAVLAQGGDADARAVKVSLQKGIAAMRSGQTDKGIAYLEQVVEKKPRVARYRLLLGTAYMKAGRSADAWPHVRRAAAWAPRDRQAQQAFLKLWSHFDRAGLLDVGADVEELKRRAGFPDRQNRERLRYGPMSVEFRDGAVTRVVDTRGLPGGTVPAAKRLWRSALDVRTWRIAHRSANRTSAVVEWVRRTESMKRATAMFSTQRLLGLARRGANAKAMMERIHGGLKRMYPTLEFDILDDGEDDVLFEWRVPAAHGRPAQHEIARLATGEADIHRIAYVARKPRMGAEERERWRTILANARLVAK